MKTIIISTIFIVITCSDTFTQWQADVRLTNNPSYSSTGYNNSWGIGANGNSVQVVWTDLRDGNNEIYTKRSTDGGNSWQADSRLTNNSAASWNSSVAVSGSNVHAVWIDDRDGNWEIYYKSSSNSGSVWGADIRLTDNASYSEFPSVAVSGTVVHVVWTDNREGNYEIYCKRSTDSGVTWGADTRQTNNTAFSLTPSVSVSGAIVNIVWRDFRDGNYEIYNKRSTDSGVTWGSDTRITNNVFDSGDPSVSSSGSLVQIVWMDTRDGNWEIFGKRSTDSGINWGPDTRLTFPPSSPASPSVAVSGTVVHIVWQDYRDGNYEIYSKRSTNSGINWNADTRLTNSSSVSEIPSVTVSGQVVHAVWTDERDGNREIYYKRDPSGNPVGLSNINTGIPNQYSLSQNYPNPFNPMTKLRFQIPKNLLVSLKIYDAIGREIIVLVNEELAAGVYETDWDAAKFPSGVYYYRISAGDFSETKKMVLVK